jgi:hypothetical protein
MDTQGWTTLNEEQAYSLLINEERIAQTGAKIKVPGGIFLVGVFSGSTGQRQHESRREPRWDDVNRGETTSGL